MPKRDPDTRVFVKVDRAGNVIPSSVIFRRNGQRPPRIGRWLELTNNVCCVETSTTTTSTTTTTTTGEG